MKICILIIYSENENYIKMKEILTNYYNNFKNITFYFTQFRDQENDVELENNDGRVKRVVELDRAIGEWAKTLSTDKAVEALDSSAVPAGRIYTVADIAKDPHYKARGNIETIKMADGTNVDVPSVLPKLSRTPGSIKTLAPDIGQNTDEILRGIGLSDSQITSLKQRGIAFTK